MCSQYGIEIDIYLFIYFLRVSLLLSGVKINRCQVAVENIKNFPLPAYEVEFCVPDDITVDGVNHGFINSQNYPSPYDDFLNCNITFLPAQRELSMALYVHDFHVERGFDFLTIVS